MIYKWNIYEKDKDIEIKFDYNVFLKRKRLYIDDKEEQIENKDVNISILSFRIGEEDYRIELTPDNYGYSGQLVTPGGGRLVPGNVKKAGNLTIPLWVLPFIIASMLIPIVSVEAVTPWLIGIISSYFIIRIENRSSSVKKTRIKFFITITVAAWAAFLIFCRLT